MSELHTLLAPWKKHAVPEPKIIEEKGELKYRLYAILACVTDKNPMDMEPCRCFFGCKLFGVKKSPEGRSQENVEIQKGRVWLEVQIC